MNVYTFKVKKEVVDYRFFDIDRLKSVYNKTRTKMTVAFNISIRVAATL